MTLSNKLILIFAVLLLQNAVLAQEIIPISEEIIDPAVTRCDPATAEEVVFCTLIYDPVCAYRDSNPPGTPGVTVGNECQACNQEGYDYWTAGACEDNGEAGEGEGGEGEGEGEGEFGEGDGIFWCEIPDLSATNIVCTLEYLPVCAYNIGDPNGVTIGNTCQACLQDGYDYYTKGECEGTGEPGEGGEEGEGGLGDGIQQCEIPDLSATNIVCTLQYEPVCAYHVGDTNGVTVGNQCQACLQQGYDYFTEGECAGNGAAEESEEFEIIEVEPVN